MYVLRLYILGETEDSAKHINELKTLLEDEFGDQYSLEVIDILKEPQLAGKDKIFATPTLAKVLPEPVRKVIGDLNDKEKVLVGLDLVSNRRERSKDGGK
jgi:circadian clock protein KaiB